MKRRKKPEPNVPEKANRILNGILVVLILVVVRIWHLAVIKHDEKLEEARKPQRRVVVERAERATICDRFDIPLATNKVQYNAAISYGPIRSLPRWFWKKNEKGKRVKQYYRKQYIAKLAKLLAEELHLDPERLEDLVHSKAAILGNVPCLIKENISEAEYFKLKMLEKDWPGIHAEIASKRCYPLGAIAGEAVGYIGPMSRDEYDRITSELRELNQCLSLWEEGENPPLPEGFNTIEEVVDRLEEMEKIAYSINDFVGKVGAEAACDTELRGLRGKRVSLTDIQGNFLRTLPGSEEAVPGDHLMLTLSSELQLYAEQLLTEVEGAAPSQHPKAIKRRSLLPPCQPWIKGGAIVAMDPCSGEILAFATFPRFDPNDFVRKGLCEKAHVNQWLENEMHLADIWDLKTPITRERFDPQNGLFFDEKIEMGWETYLNFILPSTSPVKEVLAKHNKIQDALYIQKNIDELTSLFESEDFVLKPAKIIDLLYRDEENVLSGELISLQERAFFEERFAQKKESVEHILKELSPYFHNLPLNYEKLLLIDLYRLTVDSSLFSPLLEELLGEMTLADFREASGRLVSVEKGLFEIVQELFHEHHFKAWRASSFQAYLEERRKEEKAAGKKYPKPYIEYLDHAEKELFNEFWNLHKWEFLSLILTRGCEIYQPDLEAYRVNLQNWADELAVGAHRGLPWVFNYQRLQKIADDFDISVLIPFLQSLRSFDKLERPLFGRYRGLKGKLEKHLAAAFYPLYGFGYARSHAFRQATTIGSIFKLVPAYIALCQKYSKAEEQNEEIGNLNPLVIIDDKHRIPGKKGGWNVGFTTDGKPIPLYYRGGRLPRTEHPKVGRIDLVHALEASSNPYFSMLAGDLLEDPEDLCRGASLLGYGEKTGIDLPGEYAGRLPEDVAYNRTGLYSMAIGQHSLVGTPLQTAVMLSTFANGGAVLKPKIIKQEGEKSLPTEVRWRVFLPPPIHNLLLKGLRQVVMGEKGTARFLRQEFPREVVERVIGKTSTAEAMEQLGLDGTTGSLKVKHIWFGGIFYEKGNLSKPELVVVVYLRFGEWGRDAAPIAVKIAEKWLEIKKLHQN